MFELSGLLSGSDNLFKYLFTTGVAFIIISIVYPLQKKQEIELKINGHNKEVQIFNMKANGFAGDVQNLMGERKIINGQIDSLMKKKNSKVSKKHSDEIKVVIIKLKANYQAAIDSILNRSNQLELNKINLKFSENEIETLEEHAATYKSYFFWFLGVGVICSVLGIVFWSRSTYKTERLKTLELKKSGILN